MNQEEAMSLSEVLLRHSQELNDFLIDQQDKMSPPSFNEARSVVGNIMSSIFLEGLHPIFTQHPDLKPDGLNIGRAKG